MRLSKTHLKLLAIMQKGKMLYYMPHMGRINPKPYYFCEGIGRCTNAAEALISNGLVERCGPRHEEQYCLSDAGKEFKLVRENE